MVRSIRGIGQTVRRQQRLLSIVVEDGHLCQGWRQRWSQKDLIVDVQKCSAAWRTAGSNCPADPACGRRRAPHRVVEHRFSSPLTSRLSRRELCRHHRVQRPGACNPRIERVHVEVADHHAFAIMTDVRLVVARPVAADGKLRTGSGHLGPSKVDSAGERQWQGVLALPRLTPVEMWLLPLPEFVPSESLRQAGETQSGLIPDHRETNIVPRRR